MSQVAVVAASREPEPAPEAVLWQDLLSGDAATSSQLDAPTSRGKASLRLDVACPRQVCLRGGGIGDGDRTSSHGESGQQRRDFGGVGVVRRPERAPQVALLEPHPGRDIGGRG